METVVPLIFIGMGVAELVSLYLLCRSNAAHAALRRRSMFTARLYTFSLWLGFQLLFSFGIGFMLTFGAATHGGSVSGAAAMNQYTLVFFGFIGSLCGLILSAFIARRSRPIPAGTGDLTPEELNWARDIYLLSAPCQVTVSRQKGPGGKNKITLLNNGQPLGVLRCGESFVFTVHTRNNVVTANDAAGLRLYTCAPFAAPDGGRIEIFMKGPVFQANLIYPQ